MTLNDIIGSLEENRLDEKSGIAWHSDERKKKLKNLILILQKAFRMKPAANNADFLKLLIGILNTYEGRGDPAWLKGLPQFETVKNINLNVDSVINQLKSSLKIGIVFSDIDNTLIHQERTGSCIKIADEGRFISKNAIKTAAKIMQFVPLVLISGRRLDSFKKVTHRIPYTFGIIEHGCVILEGEKVNADYIGLMRPHIGYPEKGERKGGLWDYERFFNGKGYKTDSKGRLASFRIDPEKNNLTEAQIKNIESMQRPAGISMVRNLSFLDFIPSVGGKDNAIKFILEKMKLGWGVAACMGDDLNDMGMMLKAGYPLTLSGAKEEIIRIVKDKRGYISPFSSHEGTEDMLSKIYGIVRCRDG